jgi:hypothetical protein
MAWSAFKSTVLPPMQSWVYGRSLEQWCSTFASAYDISIKTGKSTITQIPCLSGNKSAMESQLVSLLTQTQRSKTTSLLQIIGPAVISYWTGATLLNIPPSIPCPGSIRNISVTSAPVLSPGVWTPMIVPPNNNPQIFINAFIAAATIHLTTVSGLHNCICIYPGTPPPIAPGVLPWTGYTAG